ncbi:HAD-IA family hydrolase [Antarcticirhabdus aurantiaca]|uniref:HAD-IA family hydrolase n=1 Tax=Antarcticirhabdus aurantiaca TaxID=2606717 RepID=A0ACD4NV70_9HYPH|nr:HAD-IA family hydrolase [Antarcticirhabdus aurantiaca]WAJ30650.1 HAD-IA family hydrolase [Jeongeuplla avenae]
MSVAPTAIFDLDGTLVDTAPDLAASLDHCLAAAGLPLAGLARIRPHAGHGAQAMLRLGYDWAGAPLWGDELAGQTARFLAFYEANIAVSSKLYPGATDALDRLASAGFRLAVCTNKTERLARLLLAGLGLDARFSAICGADTFPARKPDPVHILGTLAQAGGEASRAVMIGDSRTDLDAAGAVAMPSVLMDFGDAALDADDRAKAALILPSFDALDASSLLCLATGRRPIDAHHRPPLLAAAAE